MYKSFLVLLITCLSIGLFFTDAQAKRFGGGRSFGVQRSASSYSRSYQAAPASSAYRNSTASRWFGPIAGLITGGLLASMLMGHGVGTGILTWLMIGAVVLMAMNWFRNRQPASNSQVQDYQSFYQQPQNDPKPLFKENPFKNAFSSTQTQTAPANFDQDNFLRDAKVQFIRLQAAYDQKNLADIRQFTAPEVFAEVQMQFNERGSADNHTEVVSVDAQLLDVNTEMGQTSASVKFTGMIKEELHAPANAFTEVWHFQQDAFSKQWLVAGIQQA